MLGAVARSVCPDQAQSEAGAGAGAGAAACIGLSVRLQLAACRMPKWSGRALWHPLLAEHTVCVRRRHHARTRGGVQGFPVGLPRHHALTMDTICTHQRQHVSTMGMMQAPCTHQRQGAGAPCWAP